jgi:hypothetical protein
VLVPIEFRMLRQVVMRRKQHEGGTRLRRGCGAAMIAAG